MSKSKTRKSFLVIILAIMSLLPILCCACTTTTKQTPTLEISDISKTYDGTKVTASYKTDSDGEVTITYKEYEAEDSTYSQTTPTNAGTYVVKVSVSESDTYKAIESTKTFTISKATPTYTTPETVALLSGETLDTIDLSSFGLEWQTPKAVVTEAGTYYATFTPTDTENYEVIEDIAINVEIVQNLVDIPTVTNTSFDYDGSSHSPTLDYDDTQVSVSGTLSEMVAGTYSITFTKLDSDTTAWSDGTVGTKTFYWTINAISVQIPTLTTSSFDYDETQKTISVSDISGFDEETMQIVTSSSTLKATKAGTYSITIALLDSTNYCWSDGTNANKILTWKIVANSYDFEITCSEGTENAYEVTQDENDEYTVKFTSITADSVYSISGTLNGHIEIDVGDDYKFELELNGITITSEITAPIQILSGDEVQLTAKKNTTNTILDEREDVSEDETQYSAAIYSVVDLVLGGKGTLNVTSENNNGIHTKDDLEVKNLTFNVSCIDNALKGNDSVTVTSGTLTLIARQGDGIKTSNSDISSKGNQRGTISLENGDITIYAACDGIDASYDATIADGVTLNIYTDKYSSYSEEVTSTTDGIYYIRSTSSSYKYSVKYTTSSGTSWANATYYTSIRSGGGPSGGTTYYYYKVDKPSSATSLVVYAYTSSQTQGQSSSYAGVSSSKATNSNYDTIVVSVSTSSKSVSTSWTNYSTSQQGPGGAQEGNSDKSDYSTKGIKADNQITISGGTITIKSYDDALHANNDETLENGSTPLGNITISGGTITLYSNDDAIHADGTLAISGGTISVTNAYEGIEGKIINITDGTITIKASDDGVNAQSSIKISGGRLDVTVSANGDTDGIDSNGTITISGGIVITRGPNSEMSSPLDADGTITINGGTVIIVGYCPNVSTSLTKTQLSGGLTSGNHTISVGGQTITYSNASSYSGKTTVFGLGTATVS